VTPLISELRTKIDKLNDDLELIHQSNFDQLKDDLRNRVEHEENKTKLGKKSS
jgi:hypothetical protein